MVAPVTFVYGSRRLQRYAKSPLRASHAASSNGAARSVYRRARALGALLAALAAAGPVPARAINACLNPILTCPCAIRSGGRLHGLRSRLGRDAPRRLHPRQRARRHARPGERDYFFISPSTTAGRRACDGECGGRGRRRDFERASDGDGFHHRSSDRRAERDARTWSPKTTASGFGSMADRRTAARLPCTTVCSPVS